MIVHKLPRDLHRAITMVTPTRLGWVINYYAGSESKSLLIGEQIILLGKPFKHDRTLVILPGQMSKEKLRFPLGYKGDLEVVLTNEGDLSTKFSDGLVLEKPNCRAFMLGKSNRDQLIKRLAGVEGQALVVMNETKHEILQPPTEQKILYVFSGNETILAITKHQLFIIDNPLVT